MRQPRSIGLAVPGESARTGNCEVIPMCGEPASSREEEGLKSGVPPASAAAKELAVPGASSGIWLPSVHVTHHPNP